MNPIPFRPDPSARSIELRQTITRAAVALLIAKVERSPVEPVVRRIYGKDRNADLITKAATSTLSSLTTTTFNRTQGLAVVSALGPASGGAPLLNGGITFTFDSNAGIYIANIVAASGNASFAAENTPIAVRQLAIDNNTLVPRWMKVIVPLTREVTEHSIPNVETMISTAIADSMALQFDSVLLGTAAASDAQPAGLRQGISGQTASTSTNRYEAMMSDLETLIGVVSAVAGNGPIALAMSPIKAAALRLAAKAVPFPYPIYASSGLASGIVCAVALNSLVSAFDPAPRLELSNQATLHLDTAATELTTSGTPPAAAYPMVNLWQADMFALKIEFQCSWALRNASGLAWLTTTAW